MLSVASAGTGSAPSGGDAADVPFVVDPQEILEHRFLESARRPTF